MANETTETLTPEAAIAGMIQLYGHVRGCDPGRAEQTVQLAVRGSGARDAVQFLQAMRPMQNPAVRFLGADMIDWYALTAKMSTTAAGRAVLREVGRMMALVNAVEEQLH